MFELSKLHTAVLAALVLICYKNSLNGELVFDDLPAIRDNRDIRPHTPLSNLLQDDFWGTPITKEKSHKSYRPLTVLSFRLNYAVHGLHPFGYHFVNLLLHLCVCILFYKLCLMFLSVTSSLVSGALFAVHPIHTEAVSGIVARAELLSAVAFLGALLFYIQNRYQHKNNAWRDCCVSSILAVLGLLCKEQAVTVLAVCCAYELSLSKNLGRVQSIRHLMLGRGVVSPWLRDKLQRLFLLSISFAAILFFRWRLMGHKIPVFSRFDNPATVSSTPTRQLTYNYLLPVNMWLLFFPWHLCCDWTMSTIPLVTSIWDIRNLATLILYVGLYHFVRILVKMDDEGRMASIMGLSLLVFPFLPASNLFFPVGFVVAERILYIPSMGFCFLVAQGWQAIVDRSKHSRWMGISCLIILLSLNILKVIGRNNDWQSEYTLYRSALAVNQRNGKLFNNMGQVYESMNRYEEALQHYRTAIDIEADDTRSYLNAGRVLTLLRRHGEAEDIYRQAKRLFPEKKKELHVTPSHLQVFLHLASLISQNESRLEEADALYREAITLRSDFTNAYLNRGDVLLKMNRSKEAESMYHRAIQFDDNNPDLHFNLGVVLMDQGKNSEAFDQFNKALDIEPDHEKSLELSAILMQESSDPRLKYLARVRLEKMVDRGRETERVYINLGLVAVENRNFQSAEKWFRKALAKDSVSREALFNLALLLSESQRESEAIVYLNKLLQHYPGHINGLLLLADVNVNYLKNLDAAEECYRKVLKLDGSNQKAQHNLCVVHFERQDFVAAETCFARTLSAHPDVQYIRHHLDIVRNILSKGVLEHLSNSVS